MGQIKLGGSKQNEFRSVITPGIVEIHLIGRIDPPVDGTKVDNHLGSFFGGPVQIPDSMVPTDGAVSYKVLRRVGIFMSHFETEHVLEVVCRLRRSRGYATQDQDLSWFCHVQRRPKPVAVLVDNIAEAFIQKIQTAVQQVWVLQDSPDGHSSHHKG